MDVKELIIRYGLVFPRRFYQREKLHFLRGLAKEFVDAGMKVDIKEAKKNQRKAYNVYVGDMNKAGLIISAYYDTPPKTFNLIKHNVFCPKGDSIGFLISIILPYLLILVAGAVYSNYVFMPVWLDSSFNYLDVLTFIPILILLFFLMYFRNGASNKPNLVRNSAALIACVKLIEILKAKDRNRINFAFTDYGCINHYGDNMLKEFLSENAYRDTVIFADCIGGNGDVIVLYSKACEGLIDRVRERASENVVFYEIDDKGSHYYSLFEKSIVLTSGKLENGAVTIEKVSTSQDNDINEENLNASIGILKEFIAAYQYEKESERTSVRKEL